MVLPVIQSERTLEREREGDGKREIYEEKAGKKGEKWGRGW